MSNSTTIQDIKSMSTKFSLPADKSRIEKVTHALEQHGFKVKVVDSLDQAKKEVEKLIPAKAEVFTATSVTLDKAGLTEELNSDKYTSVRDQFMQFYGQ